MHRFFVESQQIKEKEIRIVGADVNHIKNVLRMKPGEEICISDMEGMQYLCRISSMESEEIRAEILSASEDCQELPSKIYLFQGLPKGDKMEIIIQKAVELGVYEVIPVKTRYTVVRLDKKKEENKCKRWQMIAQSAAKQAKRSCVPNVSYVKSFREALEYAKELDCKLVPYEKAEGMEESRQKIASIKRGESVGIFIGPEGGFSAEEIEEAVQQGFFPITLGKRILRTETAGMAVLSILMFQLEE